jgi:hypothetical protein
MSKILDAQDILAEAQGCVECIYMAASELTKDGRNPIHTVADIASHKIEEAVALLVKLAEAEARGRRNLECREADDTGPVQAAPSAKPKSRPTRTKGSGK